MTLCIPTLFVLSRDGTVLANPKALVFGKARIGPRKRRLRLERSVDRWTRYSSRHGETSRE